MLAIPIFGFIAYSKTIRDNRLSEYDCRTECYRVSTTAQEVISHGMDGSHISYPTYTIEFVYKVGTRTIKNKNIVKNNRKNKELIQRAVSKQVNELEIKYDCAVPSNSLITIIEE